MIFFNFNVAIYGQESFEKSTSQIVSSNRKYLENLVLKANLILDELPLYNQDSILMLELLVMSLEQALNYRLREENYVYHILFLQKALQEINSVAN